MPAARLKSQSDDQFHAEIVDLIITECRDPAFTSQAAFARWARANKALLVGLFGGQGIQRLARVVAWVNREQTGRHRDPPEVLARYADVFAAGGAVMGYVSLEDARMAGSGSL